MTVVSAMVMDVSLEKDGHKKLIDTITKDKSNAMATRTFEIVAKSLNVNSTASMIKDKKGKDFMQGSKTEIAILEFFEKLGYPYQKDRESTTVLDVLPFSSEAKRMSCKVREVANPELIQAFGSGSLVRPNESMDFAYVKGASEMVLQLCDRMMTSSGAVVPMTPEIMNRYQSLIAEYADGALRTICCAVKPLITEEEKTMPLKDMGGLVLVGLFGILDPLRPEVPEAVSNCKDAGIVVRMVTGDSIATAKAISKGCGILTEGGLVMEGPAFRKLTEKELDEVLPKLQVLARSSPLDKQILVRNLKRLGETVAVTGGIGLQSWY